MSVVNGTIHDTKPSLLKPEHEDALLRYLYDRYVANFGRITSNLSAVEVWTTEQPEPIAINIPGGGFWYPTVNIGVSLELKGLVSFNENRTAFHLTKLGFDQADKSCFERFLDVLNKNPGGISLAALMVSIVAVIISIWKS